MISKVYKSINHNTTVTEASQGHQPRFATTAQQMQQGHMQLIVMSSASSAVTYTSVYTDSEPGKAFWGADDEEISEGGIPRYIPLEDKHEFPAEDQPLPPVNSPTAESPRYVTKSDPEEDPEEYENDETEDGPSTIL
ncbi:hypothetical protein Tco_0459659 [Tanacetum coccineum]